VDRDRRVLGLITVAGIAGLLREMGPSGATDAAIGADPVGAGAADATAEAPAGAIVAAPGADSGSQR